MRELARHDLLFDTQARDDAVVRMLDRGGAVESAFREPLARLVSRGVVGEDERVLAVLVLEEVEDAFVFEEARDEGEGGFVVLHAVVARRVCAGRGIFVVGEAQLVEEARHDVGHGLVLVDAAVGGLRQDPEPRTKLRVVCGEALVGVLLHEARDDAVEEVVGSVVEPQLDGRALADD